MARFFFLPLVFGALLCLAIRTCQADGRVFVLEMQNVSKSGYEWAKQACVAHNARLASTADLWHAVLECSFSVCTRGWMDRATVGTTICKGEGGSGLRTVDVKVEENIAEEEGTRLDAFCVQDKGSPCGSPPTFPHTRMQSQTGVELGDELVFVCEPGYSLASGDAAFSLLCDSCGEWYGLVQLCLKDDAEAHQDYEDKFPDAENVYAGSEGEPNPEGEHKEEEEEAGEVGEEAEEVAEEEVENEETHTGGGATEEGVTDGEAGPEHGGVPQETTVDLEEEEAGEDTRVEEKEEAHAGSVTDPPVSLLSQKHLFWFPSEAFHDDDDHHHEEEDHHEEDKSDHSAKETDNVAGAAAGAGAATATGMEHEEEHHHGEEEEDDGGDDGDHHAKEMPSTDEVPPQHTDKSWLDGYPVDEELAKSSEVGSEEEKEAQDVSKEHIMTKSEEVKDVQEVAMEHDLAKSEEASKEVLDVLKEHDPTKSEEVKEVVDVSEEHEPVRSEEEEEEEEEKEENDERAMDSSEETFKEVIEHPDAAVAEVHPHPTIFINISDVTTESPFHHHEHDDTMETVNGDRSDSVMPSGAGPIDSVLDTTATTVVYPSGSATTPAFFHHLHVTLATDSNEVTALAEDVTSVPFHHMSLNPDDVITPGDDLGTPLIFATLLPDDDDGNDIAATVSTDAPILIHDFSGLDSDQRHNLTKQSMPTGDPCELEMDSCSSSRSASLVAIVTVVTIVAVAGLILGAWLFRRRQLKSSHYQFNGTNTHTQNFEMQQTV